MLPVTSALTVLFEPAVMLVLLVLPVTLAVIAVSLQLLLGAAPQATVVLLLSPVTTLLMTLLAP